MADELRALTVPSLSTIPGLVHGFEQRSLPSGSETRQEARERVTRALAPQGALLLLEQVHGNDVVVAPWTGTPTADAAVATAPGLILGIETADCLPVLIADPVRRSVGAAHAGWRGTVAQVAAETVRALVARGSRASDLVAALGPCNGVCCYEVGDELRPRFGPQGAAFFQPGPRGRDHLDVRAANRQQLLEAGLPEAQIAGVPDCTFHQADLYHSYRRDGRGGGRMISWIGFESPRKTA